MALNMDLGQYHSQCATASMSFQRISADIVQLENGLRGVTTLIKPSSVNSQSVLADPLSNISVTPDTILDMSTIKITATLSCQSDNIPLASTQHSPTIEDLKVADLIRQIQDAEKIHLQIVTQLQFWQTRFVLDRRTPFDPDYLEALHDLKLKRMACQEQINSYLTELSDISNDAEEAEDIE